MPLDDLSRNTKTFFKQARFVVQRFIVAVFAFHCFGMVTFEVQGSYIVSNLPHRACLYLLQLSMHTMPSHRHLLSSISRESAEVSGWGPSATMSAPNSSPPLLSTMACPGTAPPLCVLGINAHRIPDSSIKETRPSFTLQYDFDDAHEQRQYQEQHYLLSRIYPSVYCHPADPGNIATDIGDLPFLHPQKAVEPPPSPPCS